MILQAVRTDRHECCARFSALIQAGLLCLGLSACSDPEPPGTESETPVGSPPTLLVDHRASPAARALWTNLNEIRAESVLFGHQDSLAYGVKWRNEAERSDVRDVTGDYPAVFGWDVGNLELGHEVNLDGVSFEKMQGWIKTGYQNGSVITISWHMNHPATEEPAWETSPGVSAILPEGVAHEDFKAYLDLFAEFVRGLEVKSSDGGTELVPIIFRPWHEHNGDWFWWGTRHTTEREFIELWRFTVDYLRDDQQLHNLIYAFSPDRSRINVDEFSADYLYGYPGDDYVDILGLDNYWDLGHSANEASVEQQQEDFVSSLSELVKLAEQKFKIPAMTEGGQDTLFNSNFWTEQLLAGLMANEYSKQIAYVLVWRNANREQEGKDHFYAPYTGHESADDFIEFYQYPATLFQSDLPPLYEQK